jgi:hypothetical protein
MCCLWRVRRVNWSECTGARALERVIIAEAVGVERTRR